MAALHGQLFPLQVNPRTNEIYLKLPAPHDNIIVTPPRMSDAQAITEILNDSRVYKTLVGPPFPYLLEHAESWLSSVKSDCDAVLDVLKASATANGMSVIFVDGFPVRALREVQADGSDVFLGDIGISRCHRFDYLRDKDQEEAHILCNGELPVGSAEIIWDIGDYLAPSHHGKGIMSAALRTIMHEWAVPRMNAHIIHGMAFAGNVASIKVFQKNGFKEFDFVEDCITLPESKCGGVTGLYCLEWRRPL